MKVLVLNTVTAAGSNDGGNRNSSKITGRSFQRTGIPPRSEPTFSTTSTVTGAGWRMCQPSSAGSTLAPRLSRLAIHR